MLSQACFDRSLLCLLPLPFMDSRLPSWLKMKPHQYPLHTTASESMTETSE
jgi:hypothetical protein